MNLTLNTSMQKANWLIISCLYIKQVLVKIARFFAMLHESMINFGSHHKAFTEKERLYVIYSNRIMYYVAILMASQLFLTFTYSDNVVLIATHVMLPIGLLFAQSVKWFNRFFLSTNLILIVASGALIIFDRQYIIYYAEEGGFFLYFFLMVFIVSLSSKQSTYNTLKKLIQYVYPTAGIVLCFINTSFLDSVDSGHTFHIGKTFFFNTMTVFSLCTFFLILQMTMNKRLSKKVEDKQDEIIKLIEKESKFAMKAGRE
jgi:hypothetical protein